MGRAVASMQAVGEFGFRGKNQRRGGGGGPGYSEDARGQVRQLQSRMSSSSIRGCIREDPSSKDELLHELGKGL
ncbi:SWI/SNF-related matrix-associated actin-dependent regulator of chromatin subfamily A containing DEAD/H box 1 [Bienertia sinuspersici]